VVPRKPLRLGTGARASCHLSVECPVQVRLADTRKLDKKDTKRVPLPMGSRKTVMAEPRRFESPTSCVQRWIRNLSGRIDPDQAGLTP
jgi:hypothetical protein